MSRDWTPSTLATWRSTSSPTWWPCVSLNFLKKSMSSITREQGVSFRCHSLKRRFSSSSKARRLDRPVSESVRASDSWALISAAWTTSCFSATSSRCCNSVLAANIWSMAVKTASLALPELRSIPARPLEIAFILAAWSPTSPAMDWAKSATRLAAIAARSAARLAISAFFDAGFLAASLAIFAPINQTPAANPTPSATHAHSRFTSTNVPTAAGNGSIVAISNV